MNLAWMVSTGASAGIGVIFGGAMAWQLCARRGERRRRRWVASAREQYAAGTQGLRATNARLQAALDQEKAALARRLAAAAAEHRQALARVETQLRSAYEEIDRMKLTAQADARAEAEEPHGFASTRPFPR